MSGDSSKETKTRSNTVQDTEGSFLNTGSVTFDKNIVNAVNALISGVSSLEANPFKVGDADGYINRYLEASKPAIDQVWDDVDMSINNERATAGHAFGGDRSAVYDAALRGEGLRAVGGIRANAINQGVTTGHQIHRGNFADRLNAFLGRGQVLNMVPKNTYTTNAGINESHGVSNTTSRTTETASGPNPLMTALGLVGTIGGGLAAGPGGAVIANRLFGSS